MVSDIKGFPYRPRPMTNITPFTYRDGSTYLEYLEAIRRYITDTLVPFVDASADEVLAEFARAIQDIKNGLDIDRDRLETIYNNFVRKITEQVEFINNKTGAADIQRITLTDSNYTLTPDPLWPTSQPVQFIVTQDSVGGHTFKQADSITGGPNLAMAPNAETRFTLIPQPGGKWDMVSGMDEWSGPLQAAGSGPGGVRIGEGAARHLPRSLSAAASQGFIAIGRDALGAATRGRGCIAIGGGALGLTANPGVENMGIGVFALSHVQGKSEWYGDMQGSRNIAIGSLALHFLEKGNQNTFIGRDSGHSIIDGSRNVGVGYRALGGGYAPIGLSGKIENQYRSNAMHNAALGTAALTNTVGTGNVGVGIDAGVNMKRGDNNTFLGYRAAVTLGTGISENDKVVKTVNLTGTYVANNGSAAITITNHGAVNGNMVRLQFLNGELTSKTTEAQYLRVSSVPNVSQFTVAVPDDYTDASGSVVLQTVETAETVVSGNSLVAVGWGALGEAVNNAGNTTAIGEQAGPKSTGAYNTFLGSRTGHNLVTGDNNTFVGYNAGRASITGGGLDNVSNSTAVGAGASVSGSNQVQLGSPLTSTYAYGAVQSRSDMRDKAGVRDTVLGLDFIEKLRPVDFKWNYREAKNGGKRFHHGLIAQEVQSVIEETGTDFGGFQDHAVSGGADVMSLGYEEFIAPLIKAVQTLSARVKELEAK